MLQYLILLTLAYLVSYLGLTFFTRFLSQAGLVRANYAGHDIPLGAGLYLLVLLPGLFVLAILAGVPALPAKLCAIYAIGSIGFGLAGLIDDCLGTVGDKGFRGHFRALLREGRLTSGAIKAVFGGVIALLTALILAYFYPKLFGPWYQVLLNAMVLALAANTINLFDLRPGRAGKVFFLGLIVCTALANHIDRFTGPVLLVAVAFLPLFIRDLRAELMLGDTGANFLGAAWGLSMVFWFTLQTKIVAAVLLLALQILSERVSYSNLIERVSLLRRFDRWGRGAEK